MAKQFVLAADAHARWDEAGQSRVQRFDAVARGMVARLFVAGLGRHRPSRPKQCLELHGFTLVYDAPDDAKGLKLHIPVGGFGFGKSASIKVPGAGE